MLQEKAFVNHTAYLRCNFHNPDNIDVKELIVFWQKESEVVNEVYRGQELSDNLDPKYINRTMMDMNTWTLCLLNVGIMDEGQYVCIIQHKKSSGLEKIYDSKSQLFVIGMYLLVSSIYWYLCFHFIFSLPRRACCTLESLDIYLNF